MRTHRWYAHPRQTAVVYRLAPEVRRSIADVLRLELLSASYEALARGVSPQAIVADLQSRAAALRAGTTMPGPGTATAPDAEPAGSLQWRRTRRRRRS